ncbi:MAG: hypothetical protein M3321_02885 [Actinomycetota bacterium]|nr:hypothetical protein [Actinomycetota bacterium]
MTPDGALELTDDEFAVLDYLYEIAWDDESLPALRPLAGEDPDRVARLRAAVTSLFEDELVEILGTRDFQPEPRSLERVEAAHALRDDANWALPGEPLFDGTTEYYVVRSGRRTELAYERALSVPGRTHRCDRTLG